ALEDLVGGRRRPGRQERDEHDAGDDDELERLLSGVEHAVEDPGPVEHGTSPREPISAAARFQLAGAAGDIVDPLPAAPVHPRARPPTPAGGALSLPPVPPVKCAPVRAPPRRPAAGPPPRAARPARSLHAVQPLPPPPCSSFVTSARCSPPSRGSGLHP